MRLVWELKFGMEMLACGMIKLVHTSGDKHWYGSGTEQNGWKLVFSSPY